MVIKSAFVERISSHVYATCVSSVISLISLMEMGLSRPIPCQPMPSHLTGSEASPLAGWPPQVHPMHRTASSGSIPTSQAADRPF